MDKRHTRLSRDEWVAGALEVLAEGGAEEVRVEPLARRLGVTKGSFYHHFENRQALLDALLASWEQRGTDAIIDLVEALSDDPALRLRSLVDVVFQADPNGDAIEVAVRAWASSDAAVQLIVERVDDRRVGFVADLLIGIGLPSALANRRARLLYRVLIGEFIWRSGGGPSSTRRELQELADLLGQLG
ncbi:MAG: TetR/AcrR family transcriptional regulator [Actinomycetota bacterium]